MRSNRLRGALALLMATCACFNGAARAQKSGSLADAPASVGRWTARFLNGGIYLDYDGVPLLRGGLLQLFSSDGSHGYYGSGSNPPAATVEPLPDGGRRYTAQFHYADSGRAFDATQQIDVHPQDRVTFMLRARWHASDPAQIEWNPIRLWAYPLIGADYTSRPAQGDPRAGRVGYSPLPASILPPVCPHRGQGSFWLTPQWARSGSTRKASRPYSTTAARIPICRRIGCSGAAVPR